MVRGSWRLNITATYWPPLLWLSALCLSRSPGLLSQRPTLLGDGFLYCILSATSLDPNSLGAPRTPSAWRGFPYHILSATYLQLILSDFLSWPSYIIVQRPLNLWNGMFDRHQAENNCHAVHRSLSSGASVYECTMGILACPILLANFRPRDFLS